MARYQKGVRQLPTRIKDTGIFIFLTMPVEIGTWAVKVWVLTR